MARAFRHRPHISVRNEDVDRNNLRVVYAAFSIYSGGKLRRQNCGSRSSMIARSRARAASSSVEKRPRLIECPSISTRARHRLRRESQLTPMNREVVFLILDRMSACCLRLHASKLARQLLRGSSSRWCTS